MSRETASGAALIAGALGSVITMVLHPTTSTIEGIVHRSAVTQGTHILAIACVPLLFLGLLGLHQRVKGAAICAPAALVIYGYGAVAVLSAAVINGLAAPAYATRFSQDAAFQAMLPAIISYGAVLNAGFAKVFMAANSVAIILWAIAILRTGAFPRWTGVFGGIVGTGELIGLVAGAFTTSVQSFGLFILGCSAWFVVIGAFLCSGPPTRSAMRNP